MTSEKPLVRIRRKRKESKKSSTAEEILEMKQDEENRSVYELKESIQSSFGQTADLIMESLKIAETDGMLFYLSTVIDNNQLQQTLMNKQTYQSNSSFDLKSKEGIKEFCEQLFGGSGFKFVYTLEEVSKEILNGSLAIAFKTFPSYITIAMPNSNLRQVSEPTSQTVIRGPKDSFVELASINMALVRRRIRNPNLRFEEFIIGNETQTKVFLGYMNSIANEKIVEEVRKRLNSINVSAIFESGNIEELIVDKTFTVFPLAFNTERPDTVAGQLMEGKICIIIDGTPFALLVPAVFTDFFISSEDYYHHYSISSFLRLLRYVSFMIVLIVPSAYVGILTYHQELVPTHLLINIMAQREGVPFPAVVEVLIMELTFEILREAGIRMPRAVGQTVSIVGALVIGQAAAEAGIISNIMVIIVAITATANFVAPVYSLSAATRILRLILIPIAGFLGLYGVLLGLVVMVAHLASLRSFGVPYLAPIAPFNSEDQRDVFIRFPYWGMTRRPSYLRTAQPVKQKNKGSNTPPDMQRRNDG
ncbi:spore germination protein [Niallia endozanthoxylica]|uniref:spore germination protein n=1 Tax=Niallia endozanthoxylica TaxID=2036016 RepID=UPI001CC45E6D|nr:spore germination protein [Niallia endozanthoxylica]